jgi:hypothetical protein
MNSLCSYCQEVRNFKVIDISSKDLRNIIIKEDWDNDRVYLINEYKGTADTIKINEAAEIDTVKVILDKFLEVVYRVRGGSGEHIRSTKVFCVSKGLLKESLSLLTVSKSYSSNGNLQESYLVKIKLSYKNGSYYADLTESRRTLSKKVIKKNYHLQFGLIDMVFFSKKVRDNSATICNEKNKGIKEYYSISLHTSSYINYNNTWYQRGQRCYIKI